MACDLQTLLDVALDEDIQSESVSSSPIHEVTGMVIPTAESVMTKSIVTVSPDSPILGVLQLFVEEEIHGAPVVDDIGDLVGVVTTSNLLRAENDERDTIAADTDYLRPLLEFSSPDGASALEDFQDRLTQRTVGEIMTRGAVSVPKDAPLGEVARSLRKNRIHRVWVEDEGRLVGVVSTLDLMPFVEQVSESI